MHVSTLRLRFTLKAGSKTRAVSDIFTIAALLVTNTIIIIMVDTLALCAGGGGGAGAARARVNLLRTAHAAVGGHGRGVHLAHRVRPVARPTACAACAAPCRGPRPQPRGTTPGPRHRRMRGQLQLRCYDARSGRVSAGCRNPSRWPRVNFNTSLL